MFSHVDAHHVSTLRPKTIVIVLENTYFHSFKNNYMFKYTHITYYKKIKSRKQRTVVRKYSFVIRTIQLWNKTTADALENFSCKHSNLRRRVIKVINKVK
jgi:hypothetical protein